jgi:hypothetical protein
MKKVFLTMLAFIAFSGFTYAEDKLVVGNVEIPQGGSAIVAVSLVNETPFGGFQFDMKLPAGISAKSIDPAKRITDMGITYPLSVSLKDEANNIWNVLGYNTEMKDIVGSEGDIAYITLSAAATVEKTDYQAEVTGITMSTVDAKQTTNPDATFKITVGDTWILNENSAALPVASTKKVKVKVLRTIPAGQWSTICLPFDMDADQLSEAFGEGVKLAEFTASTPEKNDAGDVTAITVGFTSVDLGEDDLYANTPYIIKVPEAVSEFSLQTTIDPEEEPVKKVKKNYFYGTMHAGIIVPENSLFISGNNFWYSKGKTTIKAFRGYFTLNDVIAGLTADSKINISVDGDATSIEGMGVQRVVEGVYDLSGRKIKLEDGDVTKLQKGVYIIDGKKVTIK